MSLLQTVLKTVQEPILAGAAAYLTEHQNEIGVDLAGAEVKAIDAIGAVVTANLPKTGVLAALAGPLKAGVSSYESQIIEALGGENKALLAVAMHQLEVLGKTGLA